MTVVNSVLTSLRYLFARTLVSEFYKKGCQEKSSTSTGRRGGCGLDVQPTAVSACPPSCWVGLALA